MRRLCSLALLGLLAACASAPPTGEAEEKSGEAQTEGQDGTDGGGDGGADGGDGGADGGDGGADGGDGGADGDDDGLEVGFEVGMRAPDFTLPDHEGELVSLSDFRGERVIVMGSAAWCPGCQELAEKMQEWYETEAEDDQIILNVLLENASSEAAQPEDVADWIARFDLTFPVVGDHERVWAEEWGKGLEKARRTYAVLDRDGVVTWFQQDGHTAKRRDLKEAINAIE